MQHTLIYRTNIAGLSHHLYGCVAHDLGVGDELTLQLVRDNAYDREAIAVLFNGQQIGWLPMADKGAKTVIWNLLEADFALSCHVLEHDTKSPLSMRLYAGIYLGSA